MAEDDYGRNSQATELEVGVYAFRTFGVVEGVLGSVVACGRHWKDGTCEAKCLNHEHDAPAQGCACGIYGCFTISKLMSQYPAEAARMVAVIAAEGRTVVGTAGLRTQFARVVAYWCGEAETRNRLAELCAKDLPHARRFRDRLVMARLYGLDASEEGMDL